MLKLRYFKDCNYLIRNMLNWQYFKSTYRIKRNCSFIIIPKVYPEITRMDWTHELLMPLAEAIKEFDSFIPRGVGLINHTSIFLLRTINHYVTFIMCTLSWFVPTGTSSEFFQPEYSPHWDIPTRSLDIPLPYGLPRTRFRFKVLECELLWTYNPD